MAGEDRFKHHGAITIGTSDARGGIGGRYAPASVVGCAEQSREAGLAIKTGPTKPVDRPVATDEGGGRTIADQRIVLDGERQVDVCACAGTTSRSGRIRRWSALQPASGSRQRRVAGDARSTDWSIGRWLIVHGNSANKRQQSGCRPDKQSAGAVPRSRGSGNGEASKAKARVAPCTDRDNASTRRRLWRWLRPLSSVSPSRSCRRSHGFCFWQASPKQDEGDQRHARYARKCGGIAKFFGDQARRRSAQRSADPGKRADKALRQVEAPAAPRQVGDHQRRQHAQRSPGDAIEKLDGDERCRVANEPKAHSADW